MDPYETALEVWVRQQWNTALRRATRCASGDAHAAEDALQKVLLRMVRNHKSYCDRIHRRDDGAIVIDRANGNQPLTDYIVSGACRDLRRRPPESPVDPTEEWLDARAQGNSGGPVPDPGKLVERADELVRAWDRLIPALDRLTNFDQIVAVVLDLRNVKPHWQPLLQSYLLRRMIRQWESRPGGTQRSDLSRGLEKMKEFFREQGRQDSDEEFDQA